MWIFPYVSHCQRVNPIPNPMKPPFFYGFPMGFLWFCKMTCLPDPLFPPIRIWGPEPWDELARHLREWSRLHRVGAGWNTELQMEFPKQMIITGWWFGTLFTFQYMRNNHPNWLICFRGVQTTNQITIVTDSDRLYVDESHFRWLSVLFFTINRFVNWTKNVADILKSDIITLF